MYACIHFFYNLIEVIGVVQHWMNKFGPVVLGWLGSTPYVFVAGPEAAEVIYQSPHRITNKYCFRLFLNMRYNCKQIYIYFMN